MKRFVSLFAAACFVSASACAVSATPPEAEETGSAADELLIAPPHVSGTYVWRDGASGAFVDFERVTLHPNGTYEAHVDSALVDPQVSCIRFPCTLPEAGRWHMLPRRAPPFHDLGSGVLVVTPTDGKTRLYEATPSYGALTLTKPGGATTTLFGDVRQIPETDPGCAVVLCPAGTMCIDPPGLPGPRCVPHHPWR